jgi:hypothetical protein
MFLNHSASGGTSARRWNSAAVSSRVLTVTLTGVLAESSAHLSLDKICYQD